MGRMGNYSDDALFDGLNRGDSAIILWLYKQCRERVIRMVRNNSGSEEDGEDIFQEALLTMIDYVKRPDFERTGTIQGLLMGIAHKKWMTELRKKYRTANVRFDGFEEYVANKDTIDAMMENRERMEILRQAMDQLSEGCQELITLVDIHDVAAAEVVAMKEWSSENYLYRRKSECKAKLRSIIIENAAWQPFFPGLTKDISQ